MTSVMSFAQCASAPASPAVPRSAINPGMTSRSATAGEIQDLMP